MITPLEILTDPITLAVISLYAVLIICEALFPARSLPKIANWQVKGIFSFFFFVLLSTYLPILYDRWLPTSQLINLTGLNHYAAAGIGILVYEMGMWLWHRTMHKSNLLWKVFHQMHHSAERVDTYGAFYFSPADMIGFTILGTICFSFILGLSADAITIILLVTNFFNVFQHANLRTPVWLGYIVQRPESHSVHHAKGVHAYNYSDLPLFDMMFGTFKNPKTYAEETGFYEGASSKVKDMLLFRDIDRKE